MWFEKNKEGRTFVSYLLILIGFRLSLDFTILMDLPELPSILSV
jgi:hypothetical protein